MIPFGAPNPDCFAPRPPACRHAKLARHAGNEATKQSSAGWNLLQDLRRRDGAALIRAGREAGKSGFPGGFLAGCFEQLQQFAVHGVVAGGNVAGRDRRFAAVEIGDEAAGLAHQQHAGRHVPRRKVALPVRIEAAGRDPGEVERGCAEAAQPRVRLLGRGDLAAREHEVAATEMRKSAGDHCVGKSLPGGDPNAAVVKKGAFAALGDKQFVVRRVEGQRGDDHAASLQRDRHCEVRDAVQKIGGSVERIDDPAVGRVGAGAGTAFLAEESVVGPRLGELLAHDLLGAPVGGRDKVARSLQRDLEVLDLAEIAFEAAAGAIGGLGHDVENCGMLHGACGTVQLRPRQASRLLIRPRSGGGGTMRSMVEGACGIGLTSLLSPLPPPFGRSPSPLRRAG